MSVEELNQDQLKELKQNYLMEKLDVEEGRCPSWGELADADEIISDEEVFEQYSCTIFSDDDFSCSCG